MRVPLLTPQDEITLAARIKKGDSEARAWMIKANLRLVVKIAHDYANLGLPLLDLISEGNIGLMKAVERFDPAKGGKLSTYGAWWIKQSIKRALRSVLGACDQLSNPAVASEPICGEVSAWLTILRRALRFTFERSARPRC